jgi:hypothetical protein
MSLKNLPQNVFVVTAEEVATVIQNISIAQTVTASNPNRGPNAQNLVWTVLYDLWANYEKIEARIIFFYAIRNHAM